MSNQDAKQDGVSKPGTPPKVSRPAPPPGELGKGRRRSVRLLLALGAVLAFLSIVSIWVERQVLDTNDFVDTSGKMLQNETIRSAVADYMVTELYNNVDIEGELAKIPPKNLDQLKQLAGPAAAGLRDLAVQGMDELLKRDTAQNLWKAANRAAHEQLVTILEGGYNTVGTASGAVTLDLGQMVRTLGGDLGINSSLTGKIPADAGQVEIVQSDELGTAQKIATGVKGLAIVFTLLAMLAFGLAIYLSRGRRWITVLFTGLNLILVAFAIYIVRRVAGQIVIDQLVTDQSIKPAAEAAWSIGTNLMVSIATSVVILGLVFIAAAWLASPSKSATATRRWMAPYIREYPGYAYGLVAVVVGIYFLIAPSQGLRSFLTAIALGIFAAIGVKALKKETATEFPHGEPWKPDFGKLRFHLSNAAEKLPSMKGVSGSISETMKRDRPADGAGGSEGPTKVMQGTAAASSGASLISDSDAENSRLDRLEKLASLHDRGALTDEEFASEKKRVLDRTSR